jgi:hypothetical protein
MILILKGPKYPTRGINSFSALYIFIIIHMSIRKEPEGFTQHLILNCDEYEWTKLHLGRFCVSTSKFL